MAEEDTTTLFEGSYFYFHKDVNYSQENFQFLQNKDAQTYRVQSEILSRVETGEFLKIKVRYELNMSFVPHMVKVEKTLGNKTATETMKVDYLSQELHYLFETDSLKEQLTRSVNAKHYLVSPSFATSTMFLLSKKLDATGRTPVVLINSTNEWTYTNPPSEKVVYVEIKARELENFKINNNELSASHVCMYEFDSSHTITEQPVNFYVSKHYSIPYQMIQGDHRITIKNLKNLTQV